MVDVHLQKLYSQSTWQKQDQWLAPGTFSHIPKHKNTIKEAWEIQYKEHKVQNGRRPLAKVLSTIHMAKRGSGIGSWDLFTFSYIYKYNQRSLGNTIIQRTQIQNGRCPLAKVVSTIHMAKRQPVIGSWDPFLHILLLSTTALLGWDIDKLYMDTVTPVLKKISSKALMTQCEIL